MNFKTIAARAAIVGGALSALGGCATITRSSSDTWTVQTEPSGAAVRTSNQFACDETPCTFKMARKAEFTVTIAKRSERVFTAAGLAPKTLAGRTVRIRGWIEERGGPWVEASRPEQIEVLERN